MYLQFCRVAFAEGISSLYAHGTCQMTASDLIESEFNSLNAVTIAKGASEDMHATPVDSFLGILPEFVFIVDCANQSTR